MDLEVIKKFVQGPISNRDSLLWTAMEEIHRHGFQGARVDRIIDAAETTKGAFYHHFSSKTELGYAVVDECLTRVVDVLWIQPLNIGVDPVSTFREIILEQLTYSPRIVELGDPVHSLGQEMSPIDEGFRRRIDAILCGWRHAVENLLKRGQAHRFLRADVNTEGTALFLLAAVQGCAGLAKCASSAHLLKSCYELAPAYLETLRPANAPQSPRLTLSPPLNESALV